MKILPFLFLEFLHFKPIYYSPKTHYERNCKGDTAVIFLWKQRARYLRSTPVDLFCSLGHTCYQRCSKDLMLPGIISWPPPYKPNSAYVKPIELSTRWQPFFKSNLDVSRIRLKHTHEYIHEYSILIWHVKLVGSLLPCLPLHWFTSKNRKKWPWVSWLPWVRWLVMIKTQGTRRKGKWWGETLSFVARPEKQQDLKPANVLQERTCLPLQETSLPETYQWIWFQYSHMHHSLRNSLYAAFFKTGISLACWNLGEGDEVILMWNQQILDWIIIYKI